MEQVPLSRWIKSRRSACVWQLLDAQRDRRTVWRLYADRCAHRDGASKPFPPAPPSIRIAARVSALSDMFAEYIAAHTGKAFIREVGYCPSDAIRSYAATLRGKDF